MQKFLVVGCGGSGQKTLGFMMDQIKADLAIYGIDQIPGVWQFVSIDTPIVEESLAKYGIPRVSEQGGSYCATVVVSDDYIAFDPIFGYYNNFDEALCDELLRTPFGLRQMATVLPKRAKEITVSLGIGSGQMRGLGRAVSLLGLHQVHKVLSQSVTQLYSDEAIAEANALYTNVPQLGKAPRQYDSPIIIICGSTCGGTGSGIVLDVARLLSSIPGVDPNQSSLLLYTSEVFRNLDAQTGGLAPNTLAFFGEALAVQFETYNSPSLNRDRELYQSLGLPIGKKHPFGQIIPIGARSFSGVSVDPEAVYRATARAVTRFLMNDGVSEIFKTGLVAKPPSPFYWGVAGSEYGWNSLGYASLSMGRDRYLEYAAQRLGRRVLDRAFVGHREGGEVGVTDKLRLDQLWGVRADHEWRDLGLEAANSRDAASGGIADWAIRQLDAEAFFAEIRRQLSASVVPQIPQMGEGVEYGMWFGAVQNALRVQGESVSRALMDWAVGQASMWAGRLSENLVRVVSRAVADYSVPYALHIVRELRSGGINALAEKLQAYQMSYVGDPMVVPQDLSAMAGGRGGLSAQGLAAQLEKIMNAIAMQLYSATGAQIVGLVGTLLKDYVTRVVVPMENALEESMKQMDVDREVEPKASGVARVQSHIYQTWPFEPSPTDSGTDSIPSRFGVADNEITLMKVDEYIPCFEGHIKQMMAYEKDTYSFAEAYHRSLQQVVTGDWPVTGEEKAPRDLVVTTQAWSPAALTGGLTQPRSATFSVKLNATDILDRARQYVLRRGEAFEQFASQSLRSYLNEEGVSLSRLQERESRVTQAMTQAIDMAKPYSAQINPKMFDKVHPGANPGLLLVFSEIPLTDSVRTNVRAVLEHDPDLNTQKVTAAFDAKCVASDVTKIDIFSSAPTTVPICYTDILEDVRRAWEEAKRTPQGRKNFWFMRRTRPLDSVLPVGRDEYEALIRGWFLALAAGALKLPDQTQADLPVRIWDFTAAEPGWVDFPHPLLTSPDRFQSNEYLPAVLESMLLCYVEAAHTADDTPFRPYRILRSYADNGNAPQSGNYHQRHDTHVLEQLITHGHFNNLTSPIIETTRDVDNLNIALLQQQRCDQLTLYCSKIRSHIDRTFLPGGEEKPEGFGAWTNYSTRDLVETTPLTIDIAQECINQLDVLRNILSFLSTTLSTAPASDS